MHRLTSFRRAILVLGLSALPVQAEVRTWTDATGKFSTKAEFVSLEDGKVTLRKENGKQVTLPLSRLSQADRQMAIDLSQTPDDSAVEEPAAPPRDATAGATRQRPASQRPASQRPAPKANNVINSVRGAVYRVETLNNLRQIALGAVMHESSKGRFPAAAIKTADGKPGLSWRVAILPFIEQQPLYRQFKLDEPWDSEHNLKLVSQMPKLYQSPGTSTERGYTNYLAVRLTNSVIAEGRGTRIQDIVDGTSRTVMLVEVDDDHAVIWTKPDDYEWNFDQPNAGLGNIWAGGQFFAAFADGRTQQLSTAMSAEQLQGLFTRNGGERVPLSPF